LFLNSTLCFVYICRKFTQMKTQTTSLKKLPDNQQFSIINKTISHGFMTLEDFSKKLDEKISTHYEKLPDSHFSKSIG